MMPGSRIGVLAALSLLALSLGACQPAPDRNLLLICLDTVRTDAFFHPDIDDELTPWLDRALRYPAARTTAPWTVPAIASTLTGVWPAGHGAGRFSGPLANLDEEAPTALPPEATTLAERLAEHGWATAAFTAHPWLTAGFGLEQGFAVLEADRGRDSVTGRLLNWLDRLDGEAPWFAYLHWMEAHDRHLEEPRDLRRRLDALTVDQRAALRARSNPELCRTGSERRCLKQQVYLDAVLDLRRGLAGLLAQLEQRGELGNTVVIAFSDHGEGFREHGREHQALQVDPRGFYGMGHGQFHFAEVMDIPLMAWVPDIEGARIEHNVSLVDVTPAALAWLGLDPADLALDGRPLPEPGQSPAQRTLYASNIAYGPETLALIQDDLKAMYWPGQDRFHLYDLGQDPGERSPLASSPALLEFTTLAGDYLERASQVASHGQLPDDEQLKALQSIGYLQGVDEPSDDGSEPPTTDNGKD